MARFLRIQIYNAEGTEIEYDNYVDDFWGIQAGSASLDTAIMQNEVKYGESYASQFQAQLFGIDDDISNRKIHVGILTDEESNYIITDEGDILTTHNGDRFVFHTTDSSNVQSLFTGIIESAKKDRMGTYRDIVAYDIFYWYRDINVVDFWNDFWENSESTTFLQLKQALYTYMNISYTSAGIMFDDFEITNPTENQEASVLKFGDLLRNIYQVQNACPHIDGDGRLVEYFLDDSRIRDLRGRLEGNNSRWEDFTTETITGVAVYSVSASLEQLYGTEENCYNITGNIFLLGMNEDEVNTICAGIMSNLGHINYVPGTYKLKLPYTDLKLGDTIVTDYGIAYVFGLSLSGSVLIEETVKCETVSATLSKDVTNLNDVQFMGAKYSEVVKTVDRLNVRFGDLSRHVESELEQQASQITLKVNSNGDIVQVALGVDPDDSSATRFQVTADNISFIANGEINLQSADLALTSDEIRLDDTGLLVRGEDYTTQITADNNVVKAELSGINFDDFPSVDWDKLRTMSEYIQSYFTYTQTRTGGVKTSCHSNSLFVLNSSDFEIDTQYGYEGGSSSSVIIGPHFIFTEENWENFLSAGGSVGEDGYLIIPNAIKPYFISDYLVGEGGILSLGGGTDDYPAVVRAHSEDVIFDSSYTSVGGNGISIAIMPAFTIRQEGLGTSYGYDIIDYKHSWFSLTAVSTPIYSLRSALEYLRTH